jgi:hypothetical protein
MRDNQGCQMGDARPQNVINRAKHTMSSIKDSPWMGLKGEGFKTGKKNLPKG